MVRVLLRAGARPAPAGGHVGGGGALAPPPLAHPTRHLPRTAAASDANVADAEAFNVTSKAYYEDLVPSVVAGFVLGGLALILFIIMLVSWCVVACCRRGKTKHVYVDGPDDKEAAGKGGQFISSSADAAAAAMGAGGPAPTSAAEAGEPMYSVPPGQYGATPAPPGKEAGEPMYDVSGGQYGGAPAPAAAAAPVVVKPPRARDTGCARILKALLLVLTLAVLITGTYGIVKSITVRVCVWGWGGGGWGGLCSFAAAGQGARGLTRERYASRTPRMSPHARSLPPPPPCLSLGRSPTAPSPSFGTCTTMCLTSSTL